MKSNVFYLYANGPVLIPGLLPIGKDEKGQTVYSFNAPGIQDAFALANPGTPDARVSRDKPKIVAPSVPALPAVLPRRTFGPS